MNDVLPQYKGPGGDFTVADYNALVRAIRRATPIQGPGTRVTRSEGGAVISVPERRFAPVQVSDDTLYPFKLSVVNAGTTQSPAYRYLVYVPSGSLYCSGVEGSCVNQLYGSDGWRRISIDTTGAFSQDSTEYPIYLVGKFAYATEEHKEVISATYVITTNPDPRYVSALGDYDSDNAFRYYSCKIGTMTQKGASSQLVCGSIVFMAPAEGGEGGGGGTQAAFEIHKTASGHFIVYLPPGCLSYKNVSVGGAASLNHSGGGAYTFTDADRELFTVEDESYWYYVANGYNGATSGDIYLQAAYSSGSVSFAVVFGASRVDGVGSNAGTGTDEDNYQSTLIAKVSSGKAYQVVHSAVRFYGIHGTLSSSDRQQLKEEIEDEIDDDLQQAVSDAEEAATAAASSATAAAGSATSAATSATNAAGSATSAATSATNASNSATAAAGSATDAAGSASDAAGSASDAADSASDAASSATAAAGSATSAANAATAAGASATAAANSATAAAGSATTASNKASEAAGSATDAANSASDAASSASDAADSASDAASSATTASGAATSAAGSATAAAQSASSASGSASSANTSAQAATTAALNANSSASDAAGSATAAAGSASDAAGSASDAAGSASDAAQSASDAAQSAQNAADAVSPEAIADAVDDAIEALQQNGTIPTLASSGTYSDSCYNSTELGTGSIE